MTFLRRSVPLGGSQEINIVVSPAVGTIGRVPKGAWPRQTESDFIHLYMLTKNQEFESEQELESFVSRYMQLGKKPKFPKPSESWHQAQEIAYRGWEKKSAAGRASVARKALKISPDAPDAYLLLAHDAPSWDEALDLEKQAAAAAERLLGDHPFEDHPEFWGPAITRPYMRARYAVAYALWRQGKHPEARDQFNELLRLNKKDNQGARYILVAILLEMGENGEAQRIIARYSPDLLAHWAYTKALMHFRRRGDGPAARDLLRQAQRINPFIPAYLLGKSPVDSWELEFIAAGEESEAIEYIQLYKEAWSMTAGALEWLNKLTE